MKLSFHICAKDTALFFRMLVKVKLNNGHKFLPGDFTSHMVGPRTTRPYSYLSY